jgi:hypothetical protein
MRNKGRRRGRPTEHDILREAAAFLGDAGALSEWSSALTAGN